MAEFPRLEAGERLSAAEIDALLAMSQGCGALQYELEGVRALLNRTYAMVDTAGVYGRTSRFGFHEDACREVASAATEYEQRLAVTCWRWVSASAVLGWTVLDRLTAGGPPLSADALTALGGEPTLDELQHVLELPVDRLLAAREPDMRARAKDVQEKLCRRLAEVRDDIAARDLLPGGQPGRHRLSPLEPPGEDPLHLPLLDALFPYAEQAPFEIAWYLQATGR